MGKAPHRESGLANALFTRGQQRVLGILFGNDGEEFSTSEIIRKAELGSGAVQRELQRLAESGIVTVRAVGNQKRYSANRSAPIYEELRSVMAKTVGLADPIRMALAPFAPAIANAFVYGSTARGADSARSDIDLMILGKNLAYAEVYPALEKTEKRLGRVISPNLMTTTEWSRKLQSGSSFVKRVASQPKIFIIGTQNELDRIG
jgi:predicted nucleotidyltransferase